MPDIADVIKYFSGVTTLPVELDQVIEYLRGAGVKDEIYFWFVESDPEILKGKMTHWEYPDGLGNTIRCLDVDISKNMDDRWQRLVGCKELLHILDSDKVRVYTEEAYLRLVEKIILPANLQDPFTDGYTVNSDRVAELQATAVLFPFAARQLLLKPFEEQKITLDDIVHLTDIPPRYVAYVMSDIWPGIHRVLTHQGIGWWRVARHRYNAEGVLGERAVLSGQLETRSAAVKFVDAIAKKHTPSFFDKTSDCWWITDKNGQQYQLLIEAA